MSRKLSLDELVVLSHDEFENRIEAAYARIKTRIERASNESRDFTDREKQLSEADRDELVALRDADELRAARRDELAQMQSASRAALIGEAVAQRTRSVSPLLPSAENLARLEEARQSFASLSLIEQRSAIKTTDMGSAVEYGPNGLAAPRSRCRLHEQRPSPQLPEGTGRRGLLRRRSEPSGSGGHRAVRARARHAVPLPTARSIPPGQPLQR